MLRDRHARRPARRRERLTIASLVGGLLALVTALAACAGDPTIRIEVPENAVLLVGPSVYLGDGRTLDQALVVLDGDRIAALAPMPDREITVPASARVIEMHGRTILPGFIDLHTHLGADGCFAGSMNEARLRRELRANLMNGVTTVLDLGSQPWLFQQRVKAGVDGWDSPEILLAGPMITAPGGHPTAAEGKYNTMVRRVSDEQQARLAVGEIADAGADVIKAVMESGGFGGMATSPSLTPHQIAAIADEAHARGMRLVVHVSSAEEAYAAAEAGADLLAHTPIRGDVDPAILEALAHRNVPVVSTLSAFEGFYRLLDDPAYVDRPGVWESIDREVVEACRGADVVAFASTNPFTVYAREQMDVARRNVAALRGAGVPVVLGTDAGNLYVFHGPAVHRELRLLVESGLTPAEAVDAATAHAADALGRSDIGAVRPGRRADLLVVAGNPAQRIDDLDRIEIVIRAGRFYDKHDLALN